MPNNSTGYWRSVYFPAIVAATGGFLFGYDLQVISGAILFLRQHFALTTAQEAFAMSSALFGCLVGPPLASLISDGPLGRRWTLMIAAILLLISAIGTAIATTLAQFNLLRAVGGVGVGLASVVSPMYIAEISPAPIRGRLVSLNQMMIVIGSFVAALVTWLLARELSPSTGWRWMFASACVPVIPFMLGLLVIPDSPRWLAQRGRIEEAQRVFASIGDATSAQSEIEAIQRQSHEEESSWLELLSPGVRTALLIAVCLALFQQWTGVSPSTFYAPTIFEMAGLGKADAIQQLVIVNVFNILCVIFAMAVVDYMGRRRLYLIGVAGMGLGMLLFGTAFHMQVGGTVLLIAYLIGFASYQFSLAPLGWLIMAEVFPTSVRAKGMAVGSLTAWLATVTGVYFMKYLLDGTEAKFGSPGPAFWGFAVVCVAAWLFGYVMLPETKGVRLEAVVDQFQAAGHDADA